jgi:hypothetical protein
MSTTIKYPNPPADRARPRRGQEVAHIGDRPYAAALTWTVLGVLFLVDIAALYLVISVAGNSDPVVGATLSIGIPLVLAINAAVIGQQLARWQADRNPLRLGWAGVLALGYAAFVIIQHKLRLFAEDMLVGDSGRSQITSDLLDATPPGPVAAGADGWLALLITALVAITGIVALVLSWAAEDDTQKHRRQTARVLARLQRKRRREANKHNKSYLAYTRQKENIGIVEEAKLNDLAALEARAEALKDTVREQMALHGDGPSYTEALYTIKNPRRKVID